jgi:hypothetical protein
MGITFRERSGLPPVRDTRGRERAREGALLLALLLLASPAAPASPCPYRPWDEYHGIKLLRLQGGSAYLYSPTQVRIDADGAPNAYHPDDARLRCKAHGDYKGLDCLPHAGYPGTSWWPSVLVPDPAHPERPYVQPPLSEFAGFFVSQTTLEDPSHEETDPARYVDSRTIPYVVFPATFHGRTGTGTMGDLGYAFDPGSGRASPFVVADVGPAGAPLGEISIALGEAIGGTTPNAITGEGSPHGRIIYVVFPQSGEKYKWPLTLQQLRSAAEALLLQAGGANDVLACRRQLR